MVCLAILNWCFLATALKEFDIIIKISNWAVKVHLLREPFKRPVGPLRDCLKGF